MQFELLRFPLRSGVIIKDAPSETVGTIEGDSINLVAYDLLRAAKSDIQESCDCDFVEAEYLLPSEVFSPEDGIDYSISAVTRDKKNNLTGRYIFGIKKS